MKLKQGLFPDIVQHTHRFIMVKWPRGSSGFYSLTPLFALAKAGWLLNKTITQCLTMCLGP